MLRGSVVLTALVFLPVFVVPVLFGEVVPERKGRLLDDIKYLASDELEGRGIGTDGLNRAADFIKREFAEAGLAVDRVDGGAFQKFNLVTGSKLGELNTLQLNGPNGSMIEVTIGKDAEVCSFGGSGSFSSDVVFLGYGIDSADDHYNDFEGVDVEGKVVIVMRRNPRQADPASPFASTHGVSRHADLRTKMTHLAEHKVAAVLFVNDPYAAAKATITRRENLTKAGDNVVNAAEEFLAASAPGAEAKETEAAKTKLADTLSQLKSLRASSGAGDDDPLMKFGYAGNGDSPSMPPAFHISAKMCDRMLAANDTDLARLEAAIDATLKPRSFALAGWSAKGVTSVEKVRTDVFNVIGVIDGEGPLANETVIVGAHYDHVGRGGQNSLAPGSTEIHNGADDNASGTVTLLELARRFGVLAQSKKPARRLVFIAFTGEELGLLGSARYTKEPVFPLESTVAMLNMDMVGRLKDDKLIIYGTGTSSRWESDLERLNRVSGFKLIFKPEGFGPSDHSSFYAKKIPVLHFFTGEHSDYHRPTDDWEKINIDGVARVADLMESTILSVVDRIERPDYIEVKTVGGPGRGGNRPYVGTVPDYSNEEPGVALSGVSSGGPADKAGIKGGDRIIKIGSKAIANLNDYDSVLRGFAPGDRVDFVVIRNASEVTLNVTLEPPR